MDEALQNLYNEIRKIIIKDNLKLMKDTSHEYITAAGEAFLDGLQINGECIEIVTKDKFNTLDKMYNQVLYNNSELRSTNRKLIVEINKLKGIKPETIEKKMKKLFNLF